MVRFASTSAWTYRRQHHAHQRVRLSSARDDVMRLAARLQIPLEQNINERLNIGEPGYWYHLRRQTCRKSPHNASCAERRRSPPAPGAAPRIMLEASAAVRRRGRHRPSGGHAGALRGGERHGAGTEREEEP
ncbi:hypothetical protein P4110_10225 [Pseudomonas aeruginosa]|nr:hypothetical protein [Pseudomonas aeruginosa]